MSRLVDRVAAAISDAPFDGIDVVLDEVIAADLARAALDAVPFTGGAGTYLERIADALEVLGDTPATLHTLARCADRLEALAHVVPKVAP